MACVLLDLFSSFDLGTNVIYKAYPIRSLASVSVVFIWMTSYWLTPTPFNLVLNGALTRLSGALVGPSFNLAGWNLILASVFILVGSMNISGLIPYVYGFSCQLYFSFSMVLPLWFALFSSSVSNNFSGYLVGFVPAGCPVFLSPMVFIMELMGTLMRLFSLGGRLAASMTMGHVVYNLAGYIFVMASESLVGGIFSLMLVQLVFLFELGICFLQCWVFWFLLKTYSEEHTD